VVREALNPEGISRKQRKEPKEGDLERGEADRLGVRLFRLLSLFSAISLI
jgi:hypothetical protein